MNGESDLGQVHDAVDGGAGGTDDLGLEGDVELAHGGVARHFGVLGTSKGADRVVGQLASAGVVARDGFRGGDVVGDRSDLLVFRFSATRHHVSDVGDGVAVEITGGGRDRPVVFSRRTVVVSASAVFGEGGKGFLHRTFDRTRGERGEGSYVQQDQNDSGQQHF